MLATMAETTSGLQLELSDDQLMLQNLARDFARKEVIPLAEHYDRSGEWPWDIFNKARKVGLVNLNIPEEYGGAGASVLEECIVGEELAYGCSGIQTALMLNQLAVLPMLVAANAAQKEKYFTRLTKEGKIIAYCLLFLITMLPLLVPLAIAVAMGPHAAEFLAKLNVFVTRHNATISAVVCFGFAIYIAYLAIGPYA